MEFVIHFNILVERGRIVVSKVTKRNRRKQNNVNTEEINVHDLITPNEVEQIRQSLIESHAGLVVRGMLDSDVRKQLEKIVARDYKMVTKNNPDVVRYVVRETIGTGVIEEILQDESITDVGYNGSELIIETNDRKSVYDTDFEITDEYIVRLVNKFANANNRDFTSKNPIFDGRFENVRINALHSQNTAPESGTTMSLRVVRPRLALTKDNFTGFAPMFMLDFFKAAALSHANMVISGTTGTGKTELHKLISSFIPFNDRIILIEDTPETFMKEMFPEKDIYSWVTNEDVGVTQLIKAGLRNHPVWMMVTETRGSEAYEMIQTVLSGHSIITSLHANDARAIPARFVNMAKMGYQLDEASLIDDIRRYFDFGIHIKKVNYHGMVVRYLSEVIEFNPNGDKTIFKQRFVDGVFHYETTEIPKKFRFKLEEALVDINDMNFPEYIRGKRPLDPSKVTSFQQIIPLDETGRPDMDKIKESGQTLEELMAQTGESMIEEHIEQLPNPNMQAGFMPHMVNGQQMMYVPQGMPMQQGQPVLMPMNPNQQVQQPITQPTEEPQEPVENKSKEKEKDIESTVENIKSRLSKESDEPKSTETKPVSPVRQVDKDVQRILNSTPEPKQTVQPKPKPKKQERVSPSVADLIEKKRKKIFEQ